MEYYSVVYFNHIATFKALYLCTSIKGGAQTCCVNAAAICNYALCMNPALSGSSEIECSDVIEIPTWDCPSGQNIYPDLDFQSIPACIGTCPSKQACTCNRIWIDVDTFIVFTMQPCESMYAVSS